jgi:hypothetical protein
MKNCRLRRIKILHWMKVGWRLSAWHTMINPPHHTKLQPPAPGCSLLADVLVEPIGRVILELLALNMLAIHPALIGMLRFVAV